MNIHALIQLLVVIEECRNVEGVVAELQRVIRAYKFSHYALSRQVRAPADEIATVLSEHWPEGWPEVYADKKYVLVDPAVRFLTRAYRPFRWRDAAAAFRSDPHRRRMETMMNDARGRGLVDGHVFPIHGRGGLLGNLTLSGNPVELSPVEISLFDQLAKKAFWRILDLRNESHVLEEGSPVDIQLTRREMEILNFLIEGSTSGEISKLLSISSHTVDWYMNGIQDKLQARNRQHIVALAFRYGLVA